MNNTMSSRQRRRMSHSPAVQVEHSLPVSNVVIANVAAVIVDLVLRISKTRMTNRGSSTGICRTFR